MKRSFGVRAAALAALAALCLLLPARASAVSSLGTDFWVAFPTNGAAVLSGGPGPVSLTVFVSSELGASGTLSIPGLGFSTPFSVAPGGIVPIGISNSAMVSGAVETTEARGIHVTSSQPVTVYGLDRALASTDAYLGLPTTALGLDYQVLAYKNTNSAIYGTQMAVLATQNGTTVTIVPSVSANGHPAGVAYTQTLNAGDVYQLMERSTLGADLSGTHITSDQPIAVYGGHLCANIPDATYCCCDHVIEQMFPLDAWGKNFVTVPLATRKGGDRIRVLAGTAGTVVSVNGVLQPPLVPGAYLDLTVTAASIISSNEPVMLAQYAMSTGWDAVTSDPFEMLLPPYEQYAAGYTVSTPASGFSQNFINIVAKAAAIGAITLDGTLVPVSAFSPVGASGFSVAQVPVSLGSHRLDGPLPFGITVYGFDNADSYGYPGGAELSNIANVSSLVLNPPTATLQVGQSHCLTATVSDAALSPVAGVRVDFGVVGVNPRSGYAFTDAQGRALFCYPGSAVGHDVISATLANLSATAVADWTVDTPTATPSFSASPTATATPTASPTATASSTFTASPTFSQTSTFTVTPTFSVTPTCTPTYTETPQPLTLTPKYPNPNPAHDKVWLPFVLSTAAEVDIKVFSIAGELVRQFDPQALDQGAHEQLWDLRNGGGRKVASGIYLCRVRARSPKGEEDLVWEKCAVTR